MRPFRAIGYAVGSQSGAGSAPAVRFMASKTKMTRQKENVPEKEGLETPPDSLDLSDAAVKKLIHTAKKRGYVTFKQINSLSKEVNSEQIEDVLAMFSEMGVNVVETEEASEEEGEREEPEEEAESESGELVKAQQRVPAKSQAIELRGLRAFPLRWLFIRQTNPAMVNVGFAVARRSRCKDFRSRICADGRTE